MRADKWPSWHVASFGSLSPAKKSASIVNIILELLKLMSHDRQQSADINLLPVMKIVPHF